ncbi:unnamed protein product [Amaranthus hypochondriacus]
MASHFQSILMFMFVVLNLLLIHSYYLNPCYAQIISNPNQNVDLTLYYETLCPYCSYFIAHHLVTLFTNDFISVVNFRLVPWGNSVLLPSGYFQCQHGSGECMLNTVEACAINVYPDTKKHYFLIQCIERLVYEKREAEWQSCFAQVSLDPQPIFDCYNQGLGSRLELQYAYETSQLNPPHAYVPWVLVNNQPLYEDYQNVITYVCRAYQGTQVPAACKTSSSHFIMPNSIGDDEVDYSKACYVGTHQNLTSLTPTEILRKNR